MPEREALNMQKISKDNVLKMRLGELFDVLHSSGNGLTQLEATNRLKEFGLNTIKKHKLNALKILLRQLKSSLIYLLAVASITAYAIADYSDGTIILIILFINTFLGFFQEYRAERAVAELAKFITTQVWIKRDGQVLLLDQSQIVPGDVVTIREGDIVPADMRLLEAEALQINESQLTGESVPVMKRVSGSKSTTDQEIAFTGSIVEKGISTGIVYATGYHTEFGSIASLSSETKRDTQYEKSLISFGNFLMKVVLLVLILVFVSKLFLNKEFSNIPALLLFIVALAVGTVPEVLPVIATVSLSNGALKLAKKHVVVKRLSAIEDLGNVNLLCTDKTGTITENKMVIRNIVSDDSELFEKLAYASIAPIKKRKHRTENSYDDAFINHASARIEKEAKSLAIIKEIPFDPEERRRRVVLESSTRHKHYLVVIGAPEVLLKISHKGHKDHYLQHIEEDGKQGLHHIALAYKEIENYDKDFEILNNEHSLTFLGYVSLYDPLRHTAKHAILHSEKLGIRVKVLTGDRKEVAEYIGKEIGLVQDGDKVYLGTELGKMPEKEFKEAIEKYNVFARVSPTQKYKIIQVLKESNVVAYQGDGINDAPSLKLADVAIAVNTATDIAKESADIVILNESLDVIINGIKYGRSIFVNINKYIRYTMSNNFGVLVGSSILYLFSATLPILPVQMLLNNLFGDIPLITVSLDTVEDDEVVQPEKHNIKDLMFISLVLGVPTALFEIFYFILVKSHPEKFVQTSLYVFFTLQALVIFYAIRNRNYFWKAKAPATILNVAFLLAFVVSIEIIYVHQFQIWFSFVPLPILSVMTILILMVAYFFIADIIKVWYYKKLVNDKN